MKRLALLAMMMLIAATGASASAGRTQRGDGLTLSLPGGWHGLVGPGGFQAADFPLGPRLRSSANLARVPRGHVHLIVSNYGPWVPYLPSYQPTRAPLALRRSDLLPGGMEGFPSGDTFARVDVRVGGDMLDVLADLGPRPQVASALRKVNAVLATLRVPLPKVVRPQNGRLAADGVSARLPPGWSGRLEIPADRYGARLVLRAARGDVHVALLEYAEAYASGHHLALPIVLTSRDTLRNRQLPLARRVFSNGGRSFDLSATARSPSDLREANRLLARLTVAPRPWTFRCCNLSLRLPGTWRAALKPRVYPTLKLYGPGVRVVLNELRPGERVSGQILRRAGRRFQVEVTPVSERAKADAVLATLRVIPRS